MIKLTAIMRNEDEYEDEDEDEQYQDVDLQYKELSVNPSNI